MNATLAVVLLVAGGTLRVDASPSAPECPVAPLEVGQGKPDPRPLLVLFERNPWLMSVGSDFPSTVVYPGDRVIYVQAKAAEGLVMEGRLAPGTAVRLRNQIVAHGFEALPANTSCSNVTDQVTVQILVRGERNWRAASGYALGTDGSCPEGTAPKALVGAYLALRGTRPAEPKAFEPEQVELGMWDFDYAKGEPIPWPKSIPPPPANIVPEYYAPYDPKAYHHVLSATHRPAIEKLLAEVTSTEATRPVLLNGHKWTVVSRWLWPGSRQVEQALRCAYGAQERPELDPAVPGD